MKILETKRLILRTFNYAQWFIEDNCDPNEMLILANQVYFLLMNQTQR